MADMNSAASLPDVQEKEHGDGGIPVGGETSENGMPWEEMEKMKEQLKVHIETIGFLLTEKTELESALTESQDSADAKQATIEELQRRLDGFSHSNSEVKGADMHADQGAEMQQRLAGLSLELTKLKSRFDRSAEEKLQLEEQLRRQSEELALLRDEREKLRRERAQFTEQQTKIREEELSVSKVESETLRLLELERNVLRDEKESLARENVQMTEQRTLRDALDGERTRQMEEMEARTWKREEELQGQRKQLESQVSSLLGEKDQLFGRCDDQQKLLEDLRLRYAVASEELSQSNETTRMVTDAYNKLMLQLDHTNRIAEAHAKENQELSRRLAERAEHGDSRGNPKMMSNGNSDDHENPDLFEKYSNNVLEHLRQNAPLIDRLQKELGSAQDTINALTNQNSELKSRTRSNNNLNEADSLQTLSRVEMERNRLREELEQLRRQHRSLEEKVELTEEDLARQDPVSGDVVVRSQFEALQSVMRRLEAKYTQVMRDKAELMDTTERLEHIITQLQYESNTIGEYVSLYHQQRFVLRQRTAEKDGYIYQLAHERSSLQNRLAQLQALIMRLLQEKHVLHTPFQESERQAALTCMESEGHEVGRLVEINGEGQDESGSALMTPMANHSSESGCESYPNGTDFHSSEGQHSSVNHSHPPSSIPGDKETAQKIMELLNEIGTSQLVDGRPLNFEDKGHVRCGHCSGQILIA